MNRKKDIFWLEILKRRSTSLYSVIVARGESAKENFKKFFDIDFEGFVNRKEIATRIIIDVSLTEELKVIFQKKIEKELGFFTEYIRKCYGQCESLLNIAKTISKTNVSDLSNKHLKKLYQKYLEEILKLTAFLNSFIVLDGLLSERIKASLGEEAPLEKLLVPPKLNNVVREIESLLKIASLIQKKPKIKKTILEERPVKIKKSLLREKRIGLMINRHLKDFGWITTLAYVGDFMSLGDIIKRLKNLLKGNPREKLEEAKKRRKKSEKEMREIIKELKLSGEILKLIKIAQECLYLRFYRIDVFWMSHYFVVNLYQEMAKRLGIGYQDILYLTHEEILDSLDKGLVINKKEIKNRQGRYAVIMIGGELEIYSGKEIDELLKEEMPKEIPEVEVIKGEVASRGKARGKAGIVLGTKDMTKIEKGDILVTNMTTPDLMPAIEKSGAIVTDEGGMLCHAAIVSRELGIPCIVGTEIATKWIKDEDKVEVDAEKGIVRKLS